MKLPRIPLLTQVSGAHLVSHLHLMALPAVLPLLPGQLGVGYVELGLALSIFNVVSSLVQAPLGFAVDRFGARRVLTFGLLGPTGDGPTGDGPTGERSSGARSSGRCREQKRRPTPRPRPGQGRG